MSVSMSLNFTISSPLGTSMSFAPASPFTGSAGSYSAPAAVPAGTTVGTFTVLPAGWQGTLTLSGVNAANFTLSGMNLMTAVNLAAATTDAIVVTANP